MAKFKFKEEFSLLTNQKNSIQTSESSSFQNSLIVTADVIHAITTDNYTHYSKEQLRRSLASWTKPYEKPVLTHHNIYNGEPIGRTKSAQWMDAGKDGTPCIRVTAEITDQDAIKKIRDGRYKTISVGGSAESVRCSICNQDLTEDWCEHDRGHVYENKVCVWILEDLEWDEWSFVNRPADTSAGLNDFTDKTTYQQSQGDGSNLSTGRSMSLIFQHSKGGSPMKLEEQVAQLTTQNQSLQNEINENKTVISSMTEETKVLKQDVSTKETELTAIKEEKNSLETKLQESTVQAEGLNTKISEFETTVTTLTEEKTALEAECVQLKEQIHMQLVTRVVEAKIASGRIKTEDKEAEITEHAKRSDDSLKDCLTDMQMESATTQTIPRVQNPGVTGSTESNVTTTNTDPVLSETEKTRIALKKAFSGERA